MLLCCLIQSLPPGHCSCQRLEHTCGGQCWSHRWPGDSWSLAWWWWRCQCDSCRDDWQLQQHLTRYLNYFKIQMKLKITWCSNCDSGGSHWIIQNKCLKIKAKLTHIWGTLETRFTCQKEFFEKLPCRLSVYKLIQELLLLMWSMWGSERLILHHMFSQICSKHQMMRRSFHWQFH